MKIGKFDTIDGEAAGYNCFVSVRTEEHATITKYNTRYFNPIREQGTFFVKPNGGGGLHLGERRKSNSGKRLCGRLHP